MDSFRCLRLQPSADARVVQGRGKQHHSVGEMSTARGKDMGESLEGNGEHVDSGPATGTALTSDVDVVELAVESRGLSSVGCS
jgi:hypothetical protein